MNTARANNEDSGAKAASLGLVALSRIRFDHLEADAIFTTAATAIATLGPWRVEASYRLVDNEFVRCPRSQPERPDVDSAVRQANYHGGLEIAGSGWARAFALQHGHHADGCLIVAAEAAPDPTQMLILALFVQHVASALACAELHGRDARSAQRLTDANTRLTTVVESLQAQTNVHQVIGAAVAAGSGEQRVVDALHELTSLSVALEDRFGNLLCWSGPPRPQRYPKPDPDRRERLLRVLSARRGPLRTNDRVVVLVRPRAEILGVLSLVSEHRPVTDDEVFALEYASSVLGLELSHQRHLAEMELSVRRELVDDLIAGTAGDGAYARATALSHDLRRPHYVVVMQNEGRADNALTAAAGRAASALGMNCLPGRYADLVVLLSDERPDPRALHRAVSRSIGNPHTAIGIGSRCDSPREFPSSFAKAQRALNIRLHSAQPHGASLYDELGFYRLVDAAHQAGAVDDFVREWLGGLIDYDRSKSSNLVDTLSTYLECGGSYDESAAALHIHRSTLRYRLARIGELAGLDLRNVDTRFNLQAATRARRFLNPSL